MAGDPIQAETCVPDWLEHEEAVERSPYAFGVTRRQFVQVLGAGLIIAAWERPALGQQEQPERRGGAPGRNNFTGGPPPTLAARLHIGKDGTVTVLTGKVECGQGSRAELTQAAAEELRLPVERIALVMADTSIVPNDGMTAGSGTTPRTVPAIRQAAATARNLLVALACKTWGVDLAEVELADGKVIHPPSKRQQTYADLASAEEAIKDFEKTTPAQVELTPVKQWTVMGASVARPNRNEIVKGSWQFPADITQPGMVYGKILRPISFGAKLDSIDVSAAKAMQGVSVVQDGQFVGVTAPTSFLAQQALDALAATAQWTQQPQPSSTELFSYLKENARGGVPKNPYANELANAAKSLRQSYQVAYVQHVPLEPRAAMADWDDGKLTVWTGTQNPFGVRDELMEAFHLKEDAVRVIVPDFGGGFGGKHTGEAAVEAARLAQATGKPVSLRWTRAEEFTWAYFRPAAVIDVEAALDASGNIASWFFVNVNSGAQALDSPYRSGKSKTQFVQSKPPLRQGSYRSLAAAANTFARECFIDELAEKAGRESLEFRLANLQEPRLKAVLEEAARRFDWDARSQDIEPNIGIGLACGTEKGSYVAACAEVEVNQKKGSITVRRVCEVFDCGAVVNPDNLLNQVEGAVIMGMGPALWEEMRFEEGKIKNAALSKYYVPHFDDVPVLDVHLLDRPEEKSAGASETPIIVIAPAIANAVYRAAGQRVREMPIRLPSE